jgi:hypothetical protein
MPDKRERPLSAEEMACLVDGRGSADQMQKWKERLIHSRGEREEFAELRELAGKEHGTVEEYIVAGLADKYFPQPALERIWLKLKQNVLEVVESSGWSRPALQYRDPDTPENALNFSRKVENLNIEFHVVRLKKDSLILIVSVKDLEHESAPSMKVSLIKDGRVINSRYLEKSLVRFKEVLPGEYDIYMAGTEGEQLKVGFRIDR